MSMPKAKREFINVSFNTPGPQKYNVQCPFGKSLGVKIGSSKKLFDVNTETPGVGSYNLPQVMCNESPRYKISGKWPDKYHSVRNSSPSPLSYNPNFMLASTFETSPKFSFSKREESPVDPKKIPPGPGHYENTTTSTQAFKFPEEKRTVFKELKDIPGPGNYDQPIVRKSNPTYSFNKSKRDSIDFNQSLPGPGQYSNERSTLQQVGGVFFKGSNQNSRKSQSPGPGTYDYFFFDKPKVGAFPKAPREMQLADQVPGPQFYEIRNNEKQRAYSFGSETRKVFETTDYQPGPGQYHLESINPKMNKVFIFGKPKDHLMISKDQLKSPSPTNYSPKNIDRTVTTVFPRAERNTVILNPDAKNPVGPGSYNQNVNHRYKFAQSRSKRIELASHLDVPGPGQYEQNLYVPMNKQVKLVVMKRDLNL